VLGFEPMTYGSESECAAHYTIAPHKGLSKGLQKVNIDMIASDLVIHLKEKRNDAEISFTEIWKNAEMLVKTVDVELRLPRLVGKQRHRENVPASTPEEYFRRTIYIPFLDSIILQLDFLVTTKQCTVCRHLFLLLLLVEQ